MICYIYDVLGCYFHIFLFINEGKYKTFYVISSFIYTLLKFTDINDYDLGKILDSLC